MWRIALGTIVGIVTAGSTLAPVLADEAAAWDTLRRGGWPGTSADRVPRSFIRPAVDR